MVIINGYKIKFGQFVGSTQALNKLKKIFKDEFSIDLSLNEYDDNLCFVIDNEEAINEQSIRNMFYFLKGYCMAHKTIKFYPHCLFEQRAK